MKQRLVSAKQLADWITAEIQKYEGCEDVRVNGDVLGLREPEPDGCNWSDSLSLSMGDADPADVASALSHTLQEARRRFNLNPDEA
jgi:hypothetical protein